MPSRVGLARNSPPARAGFSLLELLVVLVIGALLLGLALPAYRDHLLGVRRALARAELLALQMRQAQFFIDHKRYAVVLTELGMPAAIYALDADGNRRLPGEGGVIYLVAMTGDTGEYTLLARPRGAQAADERCGELSLDHLGVKKAEGAGATVECW